DNFFRPFPGYNNVWFFENSGVTDYNALQVQANRRFAGGLQFGAAYTLSRSRDYTSNNDTGTGANMQIATYQDPATWNYGLAAFARPPRGNAGSSPKDVVRGPGINNWDLTLFKNIPFNGGRRRAQLRWEIYNVFNHTQFATVDSAARFDAAGNQVNARFGQVI